MTHSEFIIPGYSVLKPLGRGGMASVYLATQESLNRKVAIKVLIDSHSLNASERFMNEAHFIASLNHPRIITIYDISTLDTGDYYIAMEYLEGGDLSQHKKNEQSPDNALTIIKQIAEGLSLVHQKGIVHRDIKPANILFRGESDVVVTDFGIAKDIAQDSDMTQVGSCLGSPAYSSPEQSQGKTLDQRSDIYSLGVILLELLVGNNIFKANSPTETAINHIQMPLPKLTDALEKYQPLLQKMLAKKPNDRFANCDELIADIDSLLGISSMELTGRSTEKSARKAHTNDMTHRSSQHATHSSHAQTTPKKIILTASITTCIFVAIAFAIYFLFIFESNEQKRIKDYLASAEDRLTEEKYTEPEYDNARYFYRQILLLDSTHHKALDGLTLVKEKQIEAYVALGLNRTENGNLDKPNNDHAIFYFQKALALDPESKAALQGLQQVANEYLRMANEAFIKNKFRQGHNHIDSGLKIAPQHQELTNLKEQYKDKKSMINNFIKRVLN